ncbi:MAG TPA: PQQ-binding-like beta-propeller repeat protein, partial [Chloroflexota bacterium]|nr:PQQ-binding-like beta-propeller repeat protein [Chloroflexota bacterium]
PGGFGSQPTIVVTPGPSSGRQSSAGGGPPAKGMYQMDALHSGRSPFTGPRKAVLRRTFDITAPEFQTPTPAFEGGDIQGSPAIGADGTIYIGSLPGTLYALRDPGAGERLQLLWRFHPAPGASSWHATPAIGPDGTVYIGFSTGGTGPEAHGTFYALRAPRSGQEPEVVWATELGPGRMTASPVLAPDGTIYIVSGAGKLFALNPTGTVRWTAQAGPPLIASPALDPNGTVYTSSIDGKLYAVAPPSGNSNEGSVRWTFDFSAHLGSMPLLTSTGRPTGADGIGSGCSPTIGPDGTIYVGANNSNMYAINPDGKLKWLFEAERELAGIWSCPAISADGSTIFFGANKGGIYALNRENGALRWQYKIFGSVFNAPTLDRQGTLYTGSTVGHLIALNSATGQPVFDFNAEGGAIWSPPSIRPDGSLVTADRKGRIMLFGAE